MTKLNLAQPENKENCAFYKKICNLEELFLTDQDHEPPLQKGNCTITIFVGIWPMLTCFFSFVID